MCAITPLRAAAARLTAVQPAGSDSQRLCGPDLGTRGESALTHDRTRAIIDSGSFEVLQSEGEPAARRHVERLLRKARTKPARKRNPPRPRTRKA